MPQETMHKATLRKLTFHSETLNTCITNDAKESNEFRDQETNQKNAGKNYCVPSI